MALSQPRRPHSQYPTVMGRALLGAYLLVMASVLIHAVYQCWPPDTSSLMNLGEVVEGANEPTSAQTATEGDQAGEPARPVESTTVTFLGFIELTGVTFELRLLLIVLFVGALGSWLHATASFVTYVGYRSFKSSWYWWYAVRPFVGAALALLFYFVLRGGLLTAGASSTTISVYGVAAFAGLAGLFTQRATNKLREIFDVVFKTDEPEQDTLSGGKAVSIATIEPAEVPAGTGDVDVQVTGGGFQARHTQVLVGDEEQRVEVQDETHLSFRLADKWTAQPQTLKLKVVNPGPQGNEAEDEIRVVASGQ